jgi:mannose-6-phosphate isomerase class I
LTAGNNGHDGLQSRLSAGNYDKFPVVEVPDSAGLCSVGWEAIAGQLLKAIAKRDARRTVLVIECYPGVDEQEVMGQLRRRLTPTSVFDASEALLPPDRVEALTAPFLGGDDPLFGFLSGLTLPQFFDEEKVRQLRDQVELLKQGLVLVVGVGARLIADGDVFLYANLTRWEVQNRFRRHEVGNLGADNRQIAASLLYKQAYFVDWRVADRWKRPIIAKWDFVLDTNNPAVPKLADGEAVRQGLRHAVTRPFRVVPFFDPAPWGGQWMKEVCGLDRKTSNYGWCFDCVPEENSLLLGLGGVAFEIPASDLVFYQPRALLGEEVHARFGDEFPIRFDLLDTMGGGNLSFQVHPLTEYIQQNFGMHYTQDESYYLLDAGPEAGVYLGLRERVSAAVMIGDLERAHEGGPPFRVDQYVNKWQARKHDHFLIPAGTVHCSGVNAVVLEISATPYIFTFKLWDWGRQGLDGKPRPINLKHGFANIQWDYTTSWVKSNLINRIDPLGEGDGWREEQTGLHEREYIDTRRHWFTKAVSHHTQGSVNVLNLVEGAEAVVTSPDGSFEPFVVHYAETFIVPANVGEYVIEPVGKSIGQRCATMKAFVRRQPRPLVGFTQSGGIATESLSGRMSLA